MSGFTHNVLGRKVVVAISVEVLVCVDRFPVHCSEKFVVRSSYNKCVQKGYIDPSVLGSPEVNCM